ncbi:DNA polymerase III subunit beta [Candidatus Collierbacteria bacterium]|nr:DNA polymerase III subunit beta [Candidatus Collierbacteria bacterium]
MKISILQENLSKAALSISKIVSSKPQLPILSNILIKAEKGKIVFLATDLSISMGLTVGGKIEEDGEVSVPAKEFTALISQLPAGKIDLFSEKDSLSIKSGSFKARLVGLSGGEFPRVDPPSGKGLEIKAGDLSLLLRRTLFVTAKDDSRPILTGIKLTGPEKGEVKAMATDGYRLSVVTVPAGGSIDAAAVIPAKFLSEADKFSGDAGIGLSINKSGEAGVAGEDGWLSGRTLAGEFPPAEKIIPEEFELEISVNRSDLERAVKIAVIFARSAANIIKWEIKSGKLKVSANSPQVGENETVLDVEGKGEGEIAFNGRYLLDYLGSTDEESVNFDMINSLKPGVFKAKNYLHVIMPVRVQK